MTRLDALVNWVTQIIMFILLASIIDLLTPESAMKKYIKLVVGLLLILILMQPIFSLFNHSVESALHKTFTEINNKTETDQNVENLINLQKDEIESTQHAYILEQMAVQLEEVAKEPLREEFDLTIQNIEFAFQPEKEISSETLEEIIVYVQEGDEERTVDHVEEIIIHTDKREQDTSSNEDTDESVIELLEGVWEADDQVITIVKEGGTS